MERKEYLKQWRKDNKERLNAYQKNWFSNNKDKRKEYNQKSYKNKIFKHLLTPSS